MADLSEHINMIGIIRLKQYVITHTTEKVNSLNSYVQNNVQSCLKYSSSFFVQEELSGSEKGTKNPVNEAFTGSFGGEGGIRTLDELSTHTRVPVVRHKPG